MNIQELNEIIAIRKEELINQNYSYNFYKQLSASWNKLLKYLKSNNLEYDEYTKKCFLEKQKDIVNPKCYNYIIYSIEAIDGFDVITSKGYTKRLIRRERNYNHCDANIQIINKYIESVSEYNSKRTISEKKMIVNEIVSHLETSGLKDLSKMTSKNITNIKDWYMKMDYYSNRKRYQWVLKDFLNFIYINNFINSNFLILFDNFSKPHKNLMTVWTKDEIEKIVRSLSEDNAFEIRNKAIVLLAIRLGIRFIDIKNLKFNNINWTKNKICFTQRKTNKYIELPLPEEVGLALINYIKKARPKSKLKYIFITHDHYHKQLSDSFNCNKYLNKVYEKAEVDYLSKNRKGIHLFRHTLASNMLENGIPLDIISSTLGHANSESSKDYLKVSDNLLENCCLDIPEIVK